MLRSVPSESYKPEYAEKYAKKIASTVYKNDEKHALNFIIRPWLMDVFKGLREDSEFVDINGKKVDHYFYYINKRPMERQTDKAISVKTFVRIGDVPALIKELENFERFPQITFLNPTTMNDNRKQRSTKDRRNNRSDRKDKRSAERTENGDKENTERIENGDRKRDTERAPKKQ